MDPVNTENLRNQNVPSLRDLVDQRNTFVSRVTSCMHLGLLPSCMGRVCFSVHQAIKTRLRKYDHQLDGILLGYENIKLIGGTGISVCNSPFIHINVHADFYVFKPELGGLLMGTVVKKHGSRVTCLVHDVITVFVTMAPSIRHQVALHQTIMFHVDHIDLCSQIPLVTGHADKQCYTAEIGDKSSEQHQQHGDGDSGISCTEDNTTAAHGSGIDQPSSGAEKRRRWRPVKFPLPCVVTRDSGVSNDNDYDIAVAGRRPPLRRRTDGVNVVSCDQDGLMTSSENCDVTGGLVPCTSTPIGRPGKRCFVESPIDVADGVETQHRKRRKHSVCVDNTGNEEMLTHRPDEIEPETANAVAAPKKKTKKHKAKS